jgi:hypothetical protein
MTDWQPIETCPKFKWRSLKGYVLVLCKVKEDCYQVFQAAYDPIGEKRNRFWVPVPDNRKKKKSTLSGRKPIQQLLAYTPTHWMPLPPPPANGDEK